MQNRFRQLRVFGIETSNIEIDHLIKAWLAISFAFAIFFSSVSFFTIGSIFTFGFLLIFLLSASTAGLGFVIHEMCHKIVAQKYSCFAEFRANFTMLMFAIISSFFGFVFAAPGAVMITGRKALRTDVNGKISMAGPLSNMLLAIVFLPLMLTGNASLGHVGSFGFMINSYLGLFNMIPFMNLDGAKILRWNKLVYGAMIAAGLVMIFFTNYLPNLH